jgi:hypothetical protein
MAKLPPVLTEETVLAKSKANSLAEVKNLNFWGTKLEDVSVVARMPNVETIALSVNELVSLEPFSHCPNLRELYLRKNKIAAFSELLYLRDLGNLRVLWLTDNPITEDPRYRSLAIATLPQLSKLDEVDISAQEKEEAAKAFPTPKSVIGTPSSPARPAAAAAAPARHPSKPAANHTLQAIQLLIQDLDKDGLQTLYDSIAQMIRKS